MLSENEMLAEQGQRVHTGASDPLNRQFAESFTSHFAELAKKYPVYGELRNIFDLAMAVALIQSEGLAERVGWKPTLLASGEKLRLPHGNAPREVETVVNHRVINQRLVIAGVSGGVMVAPGDVLARSRAANDSSGKTIERGAPVPKEVALAGAWWWDACEVIILACTATQSPSYSTRTSPSKWRNFTIARKPQGQQYSTTPRPRRLLPPDTFGSPVQQAGMHSGIS